MIACFGFGSAQGMRDGLFCIEAKLRKKTRIPKTRKDDDDGRKRGTRDGGLFKPEKTRIPKTRNDERKRVSSRGATDGDQYLIDAARRRKDEEDEKVRTAAATTTTTTRNERSVVEAIEEIGGFFEIALVDVLNDAVDAVHREILRDEDEETMMMCEIGVYKGKSFCALVAMRRRDEIVVACDCFDDQTVNVDESGVGSFASFAKSVRKFCEKTDAEDDAKKINEETGMPDFIQVLKGDSMKLTVNDFPRNRLARIFSIDGSHTEEATVSDLNLASSLTHPKGLIVLDDCFNPDWPGCISGLSSYLRNDETTETKKFTPFAIAFNKVFLARDKDAILAYKKALLPKSRKTAILFGHECSILKHGFVATFHANDEHRY
jgi:hypothetical protein